MGKGNPHPVQTLDIIADTPAEKKAYIQKTLMELLEFKDAPRVKTPEEMRERSQQYFERCALNGIKPTVEEYALACGLPRATLWEWDNGRRPEFQPIVRWAKEVIAAFDAKAVIDGKMFPTTYIFRAKNYYGMKDQQDVVVTPTSLESKPKEVLIAEAELLPDD